MQTETTRIASSTGRIVRHEFILVVGRDQGTIAPILSILKAEGFGTTGCSPRALRARLDEMRPDMIVLAASDDINPAAETCRTLRTLCATPVVVIGTRDDEFTIALVLGAGADDYLSEPLSSKEFIARVKAVLRRADTGPNTRTGIVVGPLLIDDARHAAFLDGSALSLSPTEYRLLSYLVRHPNRVVAHADLLWRVWGAGYAESHDLLRVTMSRLRRKIGADRHRDLSIRAVAGFGYRLTVEATTIGLAS